LLLKTLLCALAKSPWYFVIATDADGSERKPNMLLKQTELNQQRLRASASRRADVATEQQRYCDEWQH
jgi:hypothetical protein